MNGNKMCNILKSNIETSHIPIILLTALNDKESIIKGLQTKADKYIVKPFDMEVLKANITNVLANREIMKKRFSQFKFNADEVSDDPTVSLEQEFLLKATDIIKSSINKEMNVENLCDAMNMSRSSLYNKIKALTNDSPSDFIRKVRMNEASILENIFKGIRPAVVALIAAPTFSMAKSAKINRYTVWIPIVSALLIWVLDVSPVYIIIIAGVGGFIYGKYKHKYSSK